MTNAAGATATRSIDITVTGVSNSAPTAQLSLDPANGIAPLKTSVLIGGSDRDADALTYAVDFGDGSPEEKGDLPRAAMAHTYARPGTYIARLAVSDGELSATATATVVVVPDAPLKAVAGDDQVSIVDTAVLFDGSTSAPTVGIDEYAWDFGDGSTAAGAQATHTYPVVGEYTVKLTVTSGAETSTDEATVTVTPVPKVPGLHVTVTDGSAPLAGASIVVVDAAGARFSAVSDAAGLGTLYLPTGSTRCTRTEPASCRAQRLRR